MEKPIDTRVVKNKKVKHKSTRLFANRKSSEGAVPQITTTPCDDGSKERAKFRRSQSFANTPEIKRLEHLSTKLTLDVVNFSETDSKKKRRNSQDLGTVITGEEVIQWIEGRNLNEAKTLETAQSLLDTGMLVLLKGNNSGTVPFSKKEQYIVSFPLFKPNSIFRITGTLTPFITSSDILFTAKDRAKCDIIIKKRIRNVENGRKVKNECHILAHSQNPGIPTLLSLCQTSSSLVMMQEISQAKNLFSRTFIDNQLSENTILCIIFQIASILEIFHEQGYAYGLLNLNSIYIQGDSITERSKVSLIDTEHILRIGKEFPQPITTVFTPPEYLSNSNPKPHLTSDMWSLGVCSYWLLFGYPPYICSDLTNLPKLFNSSPSFSVQGKNYFEISPVTRMILLQLLNPDPERRITASNLVLWPRKDISNLNQILSYSFSNSWKSFLYMRMDNLSCDNNDDDDLLSHLSSDSSNIVNTSTLIPLQTSNTSTLSTNTTISSSSSSSVSSLSPSSP